jgi:hypothetical protein
MSAMTLTELKRAGCGSDVDGSETQIGTALVISLQTTGNLPFLV